MSTVAIVEILEPMEAGAEEDAMQTSRSGSGFTLIELLVAMAVTLVVMGAVVGLLTSGQASFRREPEVADMQQNLRSAMDLILRDAASAGAGIPTEITRSSTAGDVFTGGAFIQIFTPGLDNGKACGTTSAAPCPRPFRPKSTSEKTDDLALFTSNSDCGAEVVCGYLGSASNIRTQANQTCVADGGTPIFFMSDGSWTVRQVVRTFDNSGGPGNCDKLGDDGSKQRHADLDFNKGGSTEGINPAGGLCTNKEIMGTVTAKTVCDPVFLLGGGEVIGYRIAVDSDGVPNLERRSSAMLGATWDTSYRVVARGIEDLQVQYRVAGAPSDPTNREALWLDEAPPVVSGNYNTLVFAVRVTLAGRTGTGTAMTGVSDDVRGGRFIRSSLTAATAVRTALNHAARQNILTSTPTELPRWN